MTRLERDSGETRHWTKPGLAANDGYCEFGHKALFRGRETHRVNGPAIEWSDGSKMWYQDGWLHRVGGPAIEWPNGDKEWWRKGSYARLEDR